MPETITKIMATILNAELRNRGITLTAASCEKIVKRMIEATSNLDEAIKTMLTQPTTQG